MSPVLGLTVWESPDGTVASVLLILLSRGDYIQIGLGRDT